MCQKVVSYKVLMRLILTKKNLRKSGFKIKIDLMRKNLVFIMLAFIEIYFIKIGS